MSSDVGPTAEDLARDLAADLAAILHSGIPLVTHISAIRRALAAEAEAERLQAIITGLTARVAGQSELLAKAAERDALARLEAWVAMDPDSRTYCLTPIKVELGARQGDAIIYRTPGELRDYSTRYNRPYSAAAGTDDRPVTLAEMIVAALELWERLYGGQGVNDGSSLSVPSAL